MDKNIIDLTGRIRLEDLHIPEEFSEHKKIVILSPAEGIYQGLQNGHSLDSAIDTWKSLADKAISLYKKYFEYTEIEITRLKDYDEMQPNFLVSQLVTLALRSTDNSIKSLVDWLYACAKNQGQVRELRESSNNTVFVAGKSLVECLANRHAKEQEVTEESIQDEQLAEENELLLLQLQQVQEELEHYFIKCQKLESDSEAKPTSTEKSDVQPRLVVKKDTATNSAVWRFIKPVYLKLDKLINHFIYKRHAKVVQRSELFDKQWYEQTYQDVKDFRGGAALHYVAHGGLEGRDPSSKFSSERYLAMNPDVAEKGVNPLVHYELFGKKEGRSY